VRHAGAWLPRLTSPGALRARAAFKMTVDSRALYKELTHSIKVSKDSNGVSNVHPDVLDVTKRAPTNDGVAVYNALVHHFLRGKTPSIQQALFNRLLSVKQGDLTYTEFTYQLESKCEAARGAGCEIPDTMMKGFLQTGGRPSPAVLAIKAQLDPDPDAYMIMCFNQLRDMFEAVCCDADSEESDSAATGFSGCGGGAYAAHGGDRTAVTPDARDEGAVRTADAAAAEGVATSTPLRPATAVTAASLLRLQPPGPRQGRDRVTEPIPPRRMQIAIKRYIRRQQGTALAASGKREEEGWHERQDEQEFDRHGRADNFALSATATPWSLPAPDRVGFILFATAPSTDARPQVIQEPADWSPPAEEYARGFILAATACPFAQNTEDARAPLALETMFVDSCSTHHVWTAHADVTDVRGQRPPVNIQRSAAASPPRRAAANRSMSRQDGCGAL